MGLEVCGTGFVSANTDTVGLGSLFYSAFPNSLLIPKQKEKITFNFLLTSEVDLSKAFCNFCFLVVHKCEEEDLIVGMTASFPISGGLYCPPPPMYPFP